MVNINNIIKLIVVFMLLFATINVASAVWWNDSWNHKKSIEITGTRIDTDTIIEIVVDTNAISDKIRNDGYDIRFVNETSNTVLDAHDFSFNLNGYSTYYIRTNVTTVESDDIYMYYNNSAAPNVFSATKIYNTMDRFNRANSGTVGDAEIGGTWTEVETASIASNELYLDGIGNGGAAYTYIVNTSVSTYSGGVMKMRNPSSASNDETRAYVNGPGSNQQACVVITNNYFYYGSSGNFYTAFSPALVANDGQNYIVSIQHNNAASFSVWIDGVKKVTESSYFADVSWQGYFVPCTVQGTGDGISYFDNVAKFNKTDFGASVTIGGELPAYAPVISNKQPISPISKYVNSSDFNMNATVSPMSNNKWETNNGTGYILEEWDNSTTSPVYTFLPATKGFGDYTVKLTAYNTTNSAYYSSTTWDISVTWAWDRTLVSQFSMGLCYYGGNLLCGDIDNDGTEECLAVGRDANQLVILELDGTNRTYDVADPYVVWWTSLKDIDEDGDNDVVYTWSSDVPQDYVNLYEFNATHINQSNTGNTFGVTSDYPHGIAWMNISGNWDFYTTFCGGGETGHTEINYTSFDFDQIDTVANSGEDAVVFDVDNDGVDELVIAGGFFADAANVYIYEINNATGESTLRTTVLSASLDSSTHYSAYLTYGDIDNDGIENLIVLWEPHNYLVADDGIIEAYEFDTNYAVGYVEGFEIASSGTGFLENGDTKTFVADVDGDGNNELITGMMQYTVGPQHTNLTYWDVGTDGSSIDRHLIYNFTKHFGSDYTFVTPSIINDSGTIKIACIVNNGTDADFYLFERAERSEENYIYTGANEWCLFRNNTLYDSTFEQIATNETNDTSYSHYNSTSGLWESYWSGFDINKGVVINKHESVMGYFDTATTITCSVPSAESVSIPTEKWYYSYLRESTSHTLSEIRASMVADSCDIYEIYAFDNSTQSYTNTASYSVNPNEGISVYANSSCTWDGSV